MRMADTSHQGPLPLRSVGFDQTAERVYGVLLHGPAVPAALAQECSVGTERVLAALSELEAAGLVRARGEGGTREVMPPDLAVPSLVARRREELSETARAVAGFFDQVRGRSEPPDPGRVVEVLDGAAALRRLREWSRGDVRLDIGDPHDALPDELTGVLIDAATSRAVVRVLTVPAAVEEGRVERLDAAGCEIRVGAGLPTWMVIVDGTAGLLPFRSSPQGNLYAIVHSSALLTALVSLFDMLWRRAAPWGAAAAGAEPELEREVLRLLAAGLTDKTIARHLGTSLRTARRRIAAALVVLGVADRFQAGLEAARRGLV